MSGTRWTTIALGIWIALSAFLGMADQAVLWSDLLSGLAVAGAGAMLTRESTGEGLTVAFLGLWMATAAFIPDLYSGAGLFWNNLLVGGTVALLGMIRTGSARTGRAHPVS